MQLGLALEIDQVFRLIAMLSGKEIKEACMMRFFLWLSLVSGF